MTEQKEVYVLVSICGRHKIGLAIILENERMAMERMASYREPDQTEGKVILIKGVIVDEYEAE